MKTPSAKMTPDKWQPAQYYQQLEHSGDIAIQVWGSNLAELFTHAAYALFDLITDFKQIQPFAVRAIEVTAGDPEALLVAWLSELNYLFETEYFLVCQVQVTTLTPETLTAQVTGETRDPRRHIITTEIKAVTFHQLKIQQASENWTAQVIFDI
ncbi:archease [candidate division KSB1 bacterium]|nr:archease [candidate division KSB1 bacterium]